MLHIAVAATAVIAAQPQDPDTRLDWWREARFGMFIHWGLYAIPAGVWPPGEGGKEVPGVGEWIMHHGQIPPEEYEKLAPKFNPVKFDAREWVALAQRAGMKYIVVTSKHHDGFCLFDSALTTYDVIDATPFERDIMKELAGACADQGVRLGFYHSIWDWHHPDGRGDRFPRYADILRGQVRELLTNYGDVSVMWFDGEWIPEWTEPQGKALYQFCRNLQPAVIINNRVGKGRQGMGGLSGERTDAGDFGTPEQEIPPTGLPGVDWESCMTMNDTWGFKASDRNWKSSRTLIRTLIETASKGGNFLLNVGPTAEGVIPPESVERLEAIGRWLAVNGESIYGTQAGPFSTLRWGRCTAKGTTLYLHVFEWPADGRLVVTGLRTPITHAALLTDASSTLAAEPHPDGFIIRVPREAPDADATVIKVSLRAAPVVEDIPLRPSPDGTLALHAADAQTTGPARYEHADDKRCIGFWTDAAATASWTFEIPRPGAYTVRVEQACPASTAGGAYRVTVGESSVVGEVEATGSWAEFVERDLGTLRLNEPGRHTLTIRATTMPPHALMNLRSVTLTPAR